MDTIDNGYRFADNGALMALMMSRNSNCCDNRCVNQDDLNGQTLGDIKAAIPLAEAQVQLALAGVQASLTSQSNANTQYLGTQANAVGLAQANLAASLARDIAHVDTNVDRQSTAIQQAIYRDGEATRTLITSNRIADLEQQLTVAQLRETEQRAVNREQNNSHNMTVTVNQAQAQQQLQMQALQFQLAQLSVQYAQSTNSQVVVGSTGVSGKQSANPVNVKG